MLSGEIQAAAVIFAFLCCKYCKVSEGECIIRYKNHQKNKRTVKRCLEADSVMW